MSSSDLVTIRNEQPRDALAIRRVIEQAFGQPAEADLVEALRRSHALTVSLVAEIGGEVVGHVAFSPITIETRDASHDALGLAPLAVSPAQQRRGIGSMLVRHGLDACRAADKPIVVVVGHPEYYRRLGFVAASSHGIRCSFEVPAEAFLVAELVPGALTGCAGIVKYRPEFDPVSS